MFSQLDSGKLWSLSDGRGAAIRDPTFLSILHGLGSLEHVMFIWVQMKYDTTQHIQGYVGHFQANRQFRSVQIHSFCAYLHVHNDKICRIAHTCTALIREYTLTCDNAVQNERSSMDWLVSQNRLGATTYFTDQGKANGSGAMRH